MSALRKSYVPRVELGNYDYKSSAFITKVSSIAVLGGILAFVNFVPPGTFF